MEYDHALANSTNPSDFELQMKTFRRRSRMSAKAKGPAEVPGGGGGGGGGGPKADNSERPEGFTDDLSSMLPS